MVETAAPRSASRIAPMLLPKVAPEGTSLSARVVDDTAALDALGAVWTELHATCRSTAFQSFEWQRGWWRHFGESDSRLRLHVVVIEADGTVAGIAPFLLSTSRAFGVLRLRLLELMGKGITDYLDVLIRPGFETPVCETLASHLAKLAGYDAISLVDVPDHSPVRRLLFPKLLQSGFVGREQLREQCPRTQLLETWPATLASFADSHRKRVAYLDRKLKKNFAIQVRHVAHDGELDEALATFMTMHQRRWTGAGEAGAFADARAVAFHREIAHAFQRRGWLDLSFLEVGGRLASANYAFRVFDKLEFYLSGTGDSEEARKFAPGILLHAYCMERVIGAGARVYDFLRGTERYKYELGARDVPNWALLLFRSGSPITRLKHCLHVLHRKLGASAKRALARRG